MAWQVEVTDTFGGEANYCWVRRYTIGAIPQHISRQRHHESAASAAQRADQWLVREAKRLAGYTGVRGRTNYNGDMIEWRPYRVLHVMFITWAEDDAL